jgi:hypothetical protein
MVRRIAIMLAFGAAAAGAALAAWAGEPPVARNDTRRDGTWLGATPAEGPLRPFAGWLAVTGCKFRVDGSFIGRVQDGNISGRAAEGTDFNWPIAPDGSFEGAVKLGATDSGEPVFQRVRGRVERDRLVVDVEFGVPGKPETVCRGVGQTLKLGG